MDPMEQLTIWGQEFLEELARQGKSFNTLRNYQNDLDCFKQFWQVRPHLTSLQDFGPFVHEYDQYLHRHYPSPNTRRRRLQAIRLFFDTLVLNQRLPSNPFLQLAPSPKRIDLPSPPPYGDVRRLWDFLQTTMTTAPGRPCRLAKLIQLRNQIIFALIFGTGLKVSSLTQISRGDCQTQGARPTLLVRPSKRDPYTIPLPSLLCQLIPPYLKLLDQELQHSKCEPFEELLFHANHHRILQGGITARGVELLFASWSQELKLSITARNLRQACIFKWLGQDVAHGLIKEWLGVAPNYSLNDYTTLQAESLYNDFLNLTAT